MQILDEVMTSDGRGLVVGFPSDQQVEVRLLQEPGGLLVLDKENVTEIATPEAVAEHEQAKAEGVNLTVPEEAKVYREGDLNQIVHVAPEVQSQDGVPTGRDGRPLKGVALRNYLRTHPDEA